MPRINRPTLSLWLLYALVIALVLEGVLRKLIPPLSIPIFFLKDIICMVCLWLSLKSQLSDLSYKLKSTWFKLFVAFMPLFFFTAYKDLILAIFATKQYLLYVAIGLTAATAFQNAPESRFRWFLFFASSMLVPTTVVAAAQNALPATHWLNLSVGGESLEGFSAAGYLRVASTFSFTGQYSWFLNAESCWLAASFFMPPPFNNLFLRKATPYLYAVLGLMLFVGAFITGGRTAVLGCGGTLALGFCLIGLRNPRWIFTKGLAVIAVCILSLGVARAVKPEYFKAYDQRSAGHENESHSQEITMRIAESFFSWIYWFWDQDPTAVLVGNGLGIMSNGSAQVSPYAAQVRAVVVWKESDIPATLWEGGLYLAILWYGFRLTVILMCFKVWRWIKNETYLYAASVPLAYVIIHGLIAQLGMQPPLSCWWWLSISLIFTIYGLEKQQRATYLKKSSPSTHEEKSHLY